MHEGILSIQDMGVCAEMETAYEGLFALLQVVERRYHFTNCNYFGHKRRLSLA